MNPSSVSGASAQAQRQEPVEETIVPLLSQSQSKDGHTAGAGDAKKLVFNLLSLGLLACLSTSGPN